MYQADKESKERELEASRRVEMVSVLKQIVRELPWQVLCDLEAVYSALEKAEKEDRCSLGE